METLVLIPSWAWIAISTILFAFGEFLSKEFALNPGWKFFIFFMIINTISAAAWIPAIFEKNQLSITGVIWSIVSLIATVTVGILIFHERLTPTQTVGLVFGFVAVILLSR